MNIGYPKNELAIRFSLGDDRAAVDMLPDGSFKLLTTGTHDQIVRLNQRLLQERNGKGGIPLNRRIDAAGNVH